MARRDQNLARIRQISYKNPPLMRPNILLITSDRHRADHLGCMGTPGFNARISTAWRAKACASTWNANPK